MTQQEVIEACINKELEPYGITYEYIKSLPPEGVGIDWYHYYTFNSKEEYELWKEFCINLFRKELKLSKAKAEVEFDWFNLKYGLKQNYEVKI